MKPGIGLRVGVTQGDHRPYARVSGSLGPLATGMNLDMAKPAHLLLAGVAALLIGSKTKEHSKKKTQRAEARKMKDMGKAKRVVQEADADFDPIFGAAASVNK